MIGISLPGGVPLYTFRSPDLDGREYQITMDWSPRDGRWFLTLADQDGEVLQGSVRVVADWPLTKLLIDERRPQGILMARDSSGRGIDPGYEDFSNGRCDLVYFTLADLKAAGF